MMKMPELILTPTDFVALTNQILESAFSLVRIEGELANFRISRGKWVYFSIKDEMSKVDCFASIYTLPGPLKEGMLVKVIGQPRLHPQFGFSITVQSIQPSGEGAIKKAFEMLKAKLVAEGLFEPSRKRLLPYPPATITLLTSVESAAYADFVKILNARWPFCRLLVIDTLVQGESAPVQLVNGINMANAEAQLADVLVIARGGGSADDLAAFNDERVVRAVASSRIPTMVAIGHEIDESLSELVADSRASTPSNAAELLVPDKFNELKTIKSLRSNLIKNLQHNINMELESISAYKQNFKRLLLNVINQTIADVHNLKQLFTAFNPTNVLKRGYAIARRANLTLYSVKNIKGGDNINIQLKDGNFDTVVNKVNY